MSELKTAPPAEASAARREEEITAPDSQFACVRISELYSPRKVAFDLYLRLGEARYLRIFRAGETFEEAELKAYESDRGMRYVYFEREHRGAYISSSITLLQKVTPLPGVPLRTKFGVARILSELYIQSVFEADDDARPVMIERGKEICSVIAAWIDAQSGLDKFMLQLDQIDAGVPALSFLIGVLSCCLANRMPWKSRRTNETLLFACFLADIGIAALPPEIARLKPKRMNAQQKRQFEKHPEVSYFLLADLGTNALNENVLTIVRQHHEYCDGSGYPRGLTSDKTLLLSKLVVLCGDIIRTASDYLLPPIEAVKVMFPELSEKLFQEHPELVAKYEGELFPALFKLLKEGGA